MFKTLQGVSYDGGPPGQAFGGGIYGVAMDIGTSNDPTKVTLNVVSSNGTYAIPNLDVTFGGGKTIMMGTGSNVIPLYNMYVYKYNYNQTASAKTLSVSLMDHSISLDKVFVGLTARHDTSQALPVNVPFQFSVNCTECNTLFPNQVTVQGTALRTLWGTPAGAGINTGAGTGINGGYIIMGHEQWTDGNCEIPKVEYTFYELCQKLTIMGWSHNLLNFNRSDIYQASYTGSLREVLNAWASDFSFSFIVDPLLAAPTILGTDLTVPVNLAPIKAALAGGFDSGSQGLIRSQSETVTLENTYVQEPIVKNIKPARAFTRKRTGFTPVTGKPVTVTDAIGYTAHLGRSNNQMKISCALAKYKPEARMIWLSHEAAITGTQGPAWPALGFIPANKAGSVQPPGSLGITNLDAKRRIVELFGKTSSATDNFLHPIWSDPDNYYVYLGVWNEAYQSAMASYDAELAEFWNKYAYWYGQYFNEVTKSFQGGLGMTNPPASFRECPDVMMMDGMHKLYDYACQISTLPESNFYKGGNYPFQDILRANAGAFALTNKVNNPMAGGNPGSADGDSIFELSDNAWGTHPEHIENLFANRWVVNEGAAQGNNWGNVSPQSSLDHFLPIYARFDANRVLDSELRQILPNFKLDFMTKTARSDGYFPGVAIIPKMEKMILTDPTNGVTAKVLEIGSIIQQQNAVAYDNTRRRRLEMVGDNEKDCTVYCEEDIVSELCECPDIQDPLHRFSCFTADAFVIKHLGNAKTIIFPVGCDYIGYWKSDTTFRGQFPKAIDIRGAPPVNAGNVMETRVIDVDATQDIDPFQMGGGIIHQFVVRNAAGWMTSPLDIDQLYALIATMNQQSTFPGETINVQLDGIEFDTLVGLLTPANGLTNATLNLDAEGMTSDLTFASRVPKPPKRDVWMQKMGPRAITGRTGRLGGIGPAGGGLGGGQGNGVNMPFTP
jgi:hypothetical protein